MADLSESIIRAAFQSHKFGDYNFTFTLACSEFAKNYTINYLASNGEGHSCTFLTVTISTELSTKINLLYLDMLTHRQTLEFEEIC